MLHYQVVSDTLCGATSTNKMSKLSHYQARSQKCVLEGVQAPTGAGFGEGARPLPRKKFCISPLKWCILMHSGGRLDQL